MTNDVEKKVLKIFSILMDVPIKNLNKNSNPDTVENWDSLSHVKMIMEIESKFNIDLLPDEALEIFSLNDAIKIIISKISLNEKSVTVL
jgi:acyl carrier protein